jgi:hypothetical protein
MSLPLPNLDDRTYADLVEQARSQIPVEYPAWTDHNPTDTGMVLIEMLAWLTEMVLYRVNQVPNDSIETMLSLLKTGSDTNPGNGKPWRLEADKNLLEQLNFSATDLRDNTKRAIALKLAVQQTVLQLRQCYRAVTCDDFEQLVLEWSTTAPDNEKVLRVRCFAEKDLTNPTKRTSPDPDPGHVSIVVVPVVSKLLNFNTANNQVLIQPLQGLGTGNPVHTLEAWVYVQEQPSQRQCILLLGQDGWGAHHWLLQSDGTLQLGLWGGVQRHPQISVGAWTHLAVVFDGQTIKAYINGDGSINSQPLGNFSFNLTQQSLRLGRQISNTWSGESDFKGKIAEVRLWKTARTAAEIQETMHYRLTGEEPGLGGYWPLDKGSGTTVYDQTNIDPGNPRNRGTITGATWAAEDTSSWFLPGGKKLWDYLDDRRLLTTRHHVVLPVDVPLTVSATLYLADGASLNQVQEASSKLLEYFFHRSESGPYWQGQGYPIGRSLPLSEIHALLDSIAGVDYVRDVRLGAEKVEVTEATSPKILKLQPDELISVLQPQFQFKDRFGNDWK